MAGLLLSCQRVGCLVCFLEPFLRQRNAARSHALARPGGMACVTVVTQARQTTEMAKLQADMAKSQIGGGEAEGQGKVREAGPAGVGAAGARKMEVDEDEDEDEAEDEDDE